MYEFYRYSLRRGILERAMAAHQEFLRTGTVGDDILKAVIRLAKLDVLTRRDVSDSFYNTLSRTHERDLRELRRLIALVPTGLFRAKQFCALNPVFGKGSDLVGGADCDIVIDDTLIEVKTTKFFKCDRSHFHQLVGYYVLSKIGGITGLPKNHSIRKLGIYFSRHAFLWLFDVPEVSRSDRFPAFLEWFQRRAKRAFTW